MANVSNPPRKRPLAVTILSWVLLIASFLSILAGVASLVSLYVIAEGGSIVIFDEDVSEEALTDHGQLLLEGIWYSIVGVGQLIITIGFWREKRWAWVAAMSWQALKLLVDVANALTGNPEVIALAVAILLVLLLNQSDVRRVFGIRRNSNEPAPTPSLNSLDSH